MSASNHVLLSAFTIAGGSLSALNSGEGYGNVITLKKYSQGRQAYPYISGQSIRFALRNAIREHVGSNNACIYDEDGHSCGKPQTCALCDLMGFMKAEAKPKTEKKLKDEIKALEAKLEDAKGKDKESKKLQEDIALLNAAVPAAKRREELSKNVKTKRKKLKAALQKPGTLSDDQIKNLKNEIEASLQDLDQLNPRDKRQSPLQVSPLMGIVPLEDSLVTDFLTCEKPGTQDKAIVNIEASKNVYMGSWALDIRRIGFYDLLDPVTQTMTWQAIYKNSDTEFDTEKRNKRIVALLNAFRNLSGFAKQARMMDSLEADIVVFCLSPIYSHLLIKLAHGTFAKKGIVQINKDLWEQVIGDLRASGAQFFTGIRKGFLPSDVEKELTTVFSKEELVGSPYEAFNKVANLFSVTNNEENRNGSIT